MAVPRDQATILYCEQIDNRVRVINTNRNIHATVTGELMSNTNDTYTVRTWGSDECRIINMQGNVVAYRKIPRGDDDERKYSGYSSSRSSTSSRDDDEEDDQDEDDDDDEEEEEMSDEEYRKYWIYWAVFIVVLLIASKICEFFNW